MPVYFEYALKASISLAVIYLFYTLLLKRITHYAWNRYYLLIFSMLSFIVPLINIGVFVEVKHLNTVSIISKIPSINSFELAQEPANIQAALNYWQIISAIFLLVSFVLMFRLGIQLLSISRIKSTSMLLAAGEVNIYQLSGNILPFSFLNNIFVNTANYNESELPEIIEHERVHVQQRHTIDVLITEIICIFNWYNPIAWLLKKAVRENLEFIADDAVIRKGIDKKSYQYLLLKVTGDLPLSITSSFTFSSLKNRILMMNKSRTSRFHLLKFALLVPMLLVLLLAFRSGNDHPETDTDVVSSSTETYMLSALTYTISDEKVKSIVLREQAKSFLKQGEPLKLSLIYNEKDRLKTLLTINGYNNLESNAIGFMIDTASVNNSFSVEIKINVEPALTDGGKQIRNTSNNITAKTNEQKEINVNANTKAKPLHDLPPYPSGLYGHLATAQTKPGC